MIFWLDAQLPPQLALWLAERFAVEARALRDIGLRDATDDAIFAAARAVDPAVCWSFASQRTERPPRRTSTL